MGKLRLRSQLASTACHFYQVMISQAVDFQAALTAEHWAAQWWASEESSLATATITIGDANVAYWAQPGADRYSGRR